MPHKLYIKMITNLIICKMRRAADAYMKGRKKKPLKGGLYVLQSNRSINNFYRFYNNILKWFIGCVTFYC